MSDYPLPQARASDVEDLMRGLQALLRAEAAVPDVSDVLSPRPVVKVARPVPDDYYEPSLEEIGCSCHTGCAPCSYCMASCPDCLQFVEPGTEEDHECRS